ncbi:hypothetical protein like AT3G02160 [Hibiscus trionum]|uniref:Transcription initiation factor TFIID subunit 8 n=1 Tax=Hibiscus trionum TaxID=183268 RepID=A0A9W7IWX5_HIBTR|nr:hypothetical protein like AT3G02160 [Hibiscus trionum]
MNNGCLEQRKKEGSKSFKFGSKSDDFALAIAKVAAAQVCDSVGFQGFHLSALETLSDIIVRYIFSIGKSANLSANLGGRVEANLFDIIHGLEELGSGLGFAGASDVDRCVVNSGIVRDIIHFVGDADFVPFAYDVPRFPVVKELKEIGSFREKGEDPPGEHIPSWLPAFPVPETYATRSSVENEPMSVSIGKETESVLASVERKTKRSLLNLQLRIANNEYEGGSLHGVENASRAREDFEGNPYLAAPLHSGEKDVEVSPVVLPAKLSNEVTLRNSVPGNAIVGNNETFASAIDAMKSGLCDSNNGKKKLLSTQRPTLRFKIGIRKKSLGTVPDFNPRNEDLEKDDKKRRVETILKESIQSS